MLNVGSWRSTHNTLCMFANRNEADSSYHPSAEAFASMLTDLPFKVINNIVFNLVLYFMSNLRRDPGESRK